MKTVNNLLVIKSKEQYYEYCDLLQTLTLEDEVKYADEIETLLILIDNWDNKENSFTELDPIDLLKGLMKENSLKANDLKDILKMSKGHISKILNKQTSLSKNVILKLSNHFKLSQEAFNRPYQLVNKVNKRFSGANLMNTTKNMGGASLSSR